MPRPRQHLSIALAAALLLVVVTHHPAPVRAAGVVSGACTEAELEAALAGGGRVTFDCGASPVVMPITREKLLAADTVLDGGGTVTLRGSGSTRILRTADGTYTTQNGVTKIIRVTLQNIAIEHGVTADQGGGVRIGFWNDVTMRNVAFRDNRATKDSAQSDGGGALFIGGGRTAINAGNSATCPGADQRGYTRAGVCDVGAFEVGGQPFAAGEFVYLPRIGR